MSNNNGVHWVPILDGGVFANGSSGISGNMDYNVFIKSGYSNNQAYVGCVWPGYAFFVDYNNVNALPFWVMGLSQLILNSTVQFSGIWLDMDEFANFVRGEAGVPLTNVCEPFPNSVDSTAQGVGPVPVNRFAYTMDIGSTGNLEDKCISLNAYHIINSTDSNNAFFKTSDFPNGLINQPSVMTSADAYSTIPEYDFHNLNGFLNTLTIQKAMTTSFSMQLTFILGRSSMFGHGAIGQHWGGDNTSGWKDYLLSISVAMNSNMYGIP